MTDIKDKEWYDAMRAKVSEVLETLVLLEAAFVGYIQLPVAEQPITLSWTKSVVTVTVGDYKWQMPIGWFIDADMIEKIVVSQAPMPALTDVRTETAGRPTLPDFAEEDVHPGDLEEDEPAPALGETLLGSPVQRQPGVRTVDEILAESGIDDDLA